MLGFFAFFFGSYLVANLYIFIRGWNTISGLPLWAKLVFTLIYWTLTFLIFLVFKSRGWGIPEKVAHPLYLTGTTWLIFTLYMTLSLIVFDILKLFGLQWGYGFYTALGITACLLLYGNHKYRRPKVNEMELVIQKPINQTDKQLKVVGVSDIHLGLGTTKKQLKKYVRLINEQQPDILLIGGDLIDNFIDPVNNMRMDEELSELIAPLGIYMVLGNHEYFGEGLDHVQKFLDRTPVTLLRDSLITLPNGLQILGRDDRHNLRRKPMSNWKTEINPENPVILIDHQPYELASTREAGIDLQFSGHTHRGQVWPFNWLTDYLFEVSHGYKQIGDSHIVVSSGLSLWGAPIRIGTDSEIVVLNISFK